MEPYMEIWKEGYEHKNLGWAAISRQTSKEFCFAAKSLLSSISPYVYACHYCRVISRLHFFFYMEHYIIYLIFDPVEKSWVTNVLPLNTLGKLDAFAWMVARRIENSLDAFQESAMAIEQPDDIIPAAGE